jgi:hypothetical protein
MRGLSSWRQCVSNGVISYHRNGYNGAESYLSTSADINLHSKMAANHGSRKPAFGLTSQRGVKKCG